MARRSRRGGREPLARLEQLPSATAHASTEQLINSCFGEMLQKRSLEPQAVRQLADSYRGDSGYRGHLADELNEVFDEHESRLEEFAVLERHLVQAKARALADDERKLAALADTCPGYTGIGLPRGPSQLRNHLSEELLTRHNLITPSQYLPRPPTQRDPPHVAAPSYLKPTFTASQRASVPRDLQRDTTAKKYARKKQPHSGLSRLSSWKETLSPLERELEKSALVKLEEKADFLRNPKFSSCAHPNTASSGLTKLQQRQPQSQLQIFIAEPCEVVFTDYQVGQTYETTLELKNVTGASRQLRIVPLSSPYFSIKPAYFPTPDGQIAPGMHCAYTVQFTPDSLADYKEDLTVLSHSGECLTVPLCGRRPAPVLTLPNVLDCGYTLAGSGRSVTFECSNTGGIGSFRLLADDLGGGEDLEGKESSSTLRMGCFSISPREFRFASGGQIQLTVTFTPLEVGSFTGRFQMACDNGQIQSFSFKGVSERVSIGCVFIGPSTSTEVAGFTSSLTHPPLTEEDSTVGCSDYQGVCEEAIEGPSAEFPPVNPHCASYCTVVVRNFSNVNIPYSWRFFRPLTELSHTEGFSGPPLRQRNLGDAPFISELVESGSSVFSVWPVSGMLPAGETKSYVFSFLPIKVGSYTEMAHLVLPSVPDASLDLSMEGQGWMRVGGREDGSVSVVYVSLQGSCEPYRIQLHPPAILLPEKIPVSTETRKRVKLTNHSLFSINYCWRPTTTIDTDPGDLTVRVDPPSSRVVARGNSWCEVVVSVGGGMVDGQRFSLELLCDVENSDMPVTLLVEGQVQGPMVSLDSPRLNFGLISLGTSVSLQVSVINESKCAVGFQLRQVSGKASEDSGADEEEEEVEGRNDFIDHPCLDFVPSCGDLSPYGIRAVTVQCRPQATGRLRSMVACLVNSKALRYTEVRAEIQRPEIYLENCREHFDRVFVGVPACRNILFRNCGLIASQFAWSSLVQGDSKEHCSVEFHPTSGRVGPRETVTVRLQATWKKVGSHPEVVARCTILGQDSPLLLCLSAEVFGLSVQYSTRLTELNGTRSSRDLALDFGSGNSLVPSSPRTLSLVVTNTSAIPTSFCAHVVNLPAARMPTPPAGQPVGTAKATSLRGRYLLSKTVNIGDSSSKTQQKANKDYSSALLREGRGCCFVVDPQRAELPPFESREIRVTAHCDMWGYYQDHLHCEVCGLESRVVPIYFGVAGCPIVFTSTASSAQTLLRLGSHPPNACMVKRVLKLCNTSPCAIRVDWEMFSILQDDNGKLVDLITSIGDPFPLRESPDLVAKCWSSVSLEEEEEEEEGEEREEEDAGKEGEEEEEDGGALIRVLLKAHEGVPLTEPFNILPKQLIIPAHGHAAMEVMFQPSISALERLGESLASYALGYLSLDQQCPPGVARLGGYDVQPLRIDILAGIQHAKLSLEDEDGESLTFSCPSSILLCGDKIEDQATLTHHITLLNPNSSTLQFTLSSSSPRFTLPSSCPGPTPDHCQGPITLEPQKSISVAVCFTLEHRDVLSIGSTQDELTFSGQLKADFSTGASQEFELTALVAVPVLSLSARGVEFPTCWLHSSTTFLLSLSNLTSSAAVWTSQVPQELQDVISINPGNGILAPGSGILVPRTLEAGPSYESITMSFSPRREDIYTGTVTFVELLTARTYRVGLAWSGSANERFKQTMS